MFLIVFTTQGRGGGLLPTPLRIVLICQTFSIARRSLLATFPKCQPLPFAKLSQMLEVSQIRIILVSFRKLSQGWTGPARVSKGQECESFLLPLAAFSMV